MLSDYVVEACGLLQLKLAQAVFERTRTGAVSKESLDAVRLSLVVFSEGIESTQEMFDSKDELFKVQYVNDFMEMFRMLIEIERAVEQFLVDEGMSPAVDMLKYCEQIVKLEDPRKEL